MATTFSDIRKVLDGEFKAATLDISADNRILESVKYSPQDNTPYLAAFLLPVASDSSRPSDDDLHTGIYQIDVNYPQATGPTKITEMVDDLRTVFRPGSYFEWNTVCVRIDAFIPGRIQVSNGWTTISVTVDWRTFTAR